MQLLPQSHLCWLQLGYELLLLKAVLSGEGPCLWETLCVLAGMLEMCLHSGLLLKEEEVVCLTS